MAIDFSIRLRNIPTAIRMVREEILQITRRELNLRTQLLLADLRAATPVDTGRARRGWFATRARNSFGEIRLEVRNNVPYINDLNMGNSRQAPPRFIELAALRYFTPDGTIVQVR